GRLTRQQISPSVASMRTPNRLAASAMLRGGSLIIVIFVVVASPIHLEALQAGGIALVEDHTEHPLPGNFHAAERLGNHFLGRLAPFHDHHELVDQMAYRLDVDNRDDGRKVEN